MEIGRITKSTAIDGFGVGVGDGVQRGGGDVTERCVSPTARFIRSDVHY